MMIKALSAEEYERVLLEVDSNPPIEQLGIWQDYEATIDGRTPWGFVEITDNSGAVVAVASLIEFETHGYRFLRSMHGPVWACPPSEQEEHAVLEALISYVRGRDSRQAFMRLAVAHESGLTRPCLSTRPYDTTVIVNLTGGDEAILSRMKPRGRRDVRKALRESPASCADETELALASFEEYYDVMRETAERDGFVPAPLSDYEDMIRTLGPSHCRVFAGRHDGRVATWSIVTISGHRATRYYGASRNDTMRLHVTDKLVYFECCELGSRGLEEYDLMGIGSELTPELMGLNEFKTKFAKEGVRTIAPDRDVPIKRAFYAGLTKVRDVRDYLRGGRK